jgi:hypothetical protein
VNERLVARVSKGKTLLLLLIGAGFVAIGIWFVARPEELAGGSRLRDPAMIWGFGWIAILFFGACFVAIFSQLFRTAPVIEIDSRGILHRRWSDQIIPWTAIVRIEPRAVHNQKFLCLWLDAPERYPARSGRLAHLNKGMGFGDLSLSMQGTDQSFDRLVEVVGAHLAARDRPGTGQS